jgi:hypothetical protein
MDFSQFPDESAKTTSDYKTEKGQSACGGRLSFSFQTGLTGSLGCFFYHLPWERDKKSSQSS